MGALEQAIGSAMRKTAKVMQFAEILTGTASDISETSLTVLREDAPTIYNVSLNAIIDDEMQSYFIIYPSPGSDVVVGILDGIKEDAVLLQCSAISKVAIKIGEQTLTITDSGFVFNEGKNSGLVVASRVKDEGDRTTQAITTLLQALRTAFSTIEGVYPSGASAAFNAAVASLPKADYTDIVNDKVKH